MSYPHPDLSVFVQGDSNPRRISFTVQRNSEGTLNFHIVDDDAVEDTVVRPGGSDQAVAPSPMSEHPERTQRRYLAFLNNSATSRIDENSDEELVSPRATYALPSQNPGVSHTSASLVASPRPRGPAPFASSRGGLPGASGTSSVEASPRAPSYYGSSGGVGFTSASPGHPDNSLRLSPGEAAIAALRAASPRLGPSSSPVPVAPPAPVAPSAPIAPAAPLAPVPPTAPAAPAAPAVPVAPQAPVAPPVPAPRGSHITAGVNGSGVNTPTQPAHSPSSSFGPAPGAPGSSLPAPPPPGRPHPGSAGPALSPAASSTSTGAGAGVGLAVAGGAAAAPPAGSGTTTPTPTGARSPMSFFSRAGAPAPLTTTTGTGAPAAPSSGAAHAALSPGAPVAPPVPPTPLAVSAAHTPTHAGAGPHAGAGAGAGSGTAASTPSHGGTGTVGALPSGYTIIGDGTPVVVTHHVRTASYDASRDPFAAGGGAGLPNLSASERAKRGTLVIREPPAGSAAAAAGAAGAGAAGAAAPSTVQHVRRTAHFTFDPETGTFSDVPPEWQEALSKAFGLPLALCASKAVPGYAARLPPVLVHLKQQLVINGGLNSVGIFRIAPGNDDAVALKAHLNVCGPCSGKAFPTCADYNVVANLIKVWFRDMPARLLDAIPSTEEVTAAAAVNTPEAAAAVVLRHFKEPQLSLLLWLLDLCVDVSANAAVNRMTAQNMAIVISPNLFRLADAGNAPAGMDPMQQIAICKKFAVFFQNLIHWRAVDEERPGGPVPSVAFGASVVATGAHV